METIPNTGLQSLPNIVQQLPKVNESNERQVNPLVIFQVLRALRFS